MLFFPYRFDAELSRVPIVTILASLICILLYTLQFMNALDFSKKTEAFCSKERSNLHSIIFEKSMGNYPPEGCLSFVEEIAISDDPELVLTEFAQDSELLAGFEQSRNQQYVHNFLVDEYRRYQFEVPALKTTQLWYAPQSWNPLTMITSSFAHASWDHLIGNLFFFFAFAAAVELIVGSGVFLVIIFTMAFGTNIAYSLAMLPVEKPLPTVGLSGVVMGMIAMLAFFLPTAKIRCFYWVIIKFGTFAISAWLLALFYIGVDILTLLRQEELGSVNLIAHVSGAMIGVVIAVLLTNFYKDKLTLDF